jgi:hypothetical protein
MKNNSKTMWKRATTHKENNTNVSNNANANNNQKNKTKHNQQDKNIVTKQKMSLWRKKSSSFILYNFQYP